MPVRKPSVITAATGPAAATNPAAPDRVPHAPRSSPRLPDIDTARCTGCGWCVAACDLHLLSLEVVRWQKFSVLHEPERCTGCSDCAVKCPFHVITMRRPGTADTTAIADAAPPPTPPG